MGLWGTGPHMACAGPPSLLGDVILPPTLLPCLIIRWPVFVAVLCHIPALSAAFSHRKLSTSLSFFFFQITVSFVFLCLPQIVADRDVWYSIFGGSGGTEWTCEEITVREVEQQQCTDYRQDLCEEHMISSLIPLSDWLWWRGSRGRDQRGVGLDSLGQSQIRTESDDSGS